MRKKRSWAGIIATGALAAMLAMPGSALARPASEVFSDVAADGWYAGEVQWVYDNDVMRGYGDGTVFGVGQTLTRAELAAVLANHAGAVYDSTRNTTGISDLDAIDWYTGVCNWAVENGVILGYDGADAFGPNDPVTREQAVVILARYAGADVKPGDGDISSFPDAADVSAWATGGVAWATDIGVITGVVRADGDYIEPGRAVMREEIAKMLHVTADAMDAGTVNPGPDQDEDPVDPDEPDPDEGDAGTDPDEPDPTDPDEGDDPVEPDPVDPDAGDNGDDDTTPATHEHMWTAVTETVRMKGYICGTCGTITDTYSDAVAHQKASGRGGCGAFGTHYWNEDVTVGYTCAGCGAHKDA